jgi:uncharacterized protein YndB with AHSA1/START domain
VSDGTIEQKEGRVTFRYERRLNHPIGEVWQAITDPTAMEPWLGNRPEIELKPGGEYVSYHRSGDRVADRVLRIGPPRLFEHTYWVQVNPTAVVTWELSPTEEGCRLTLTHSLAMEDVRTAAATVAQGDAISVILSRNAAGWHRLLDKLAASLDGRSTEWSAQDQQALQERYAGLLG